MITIFSEINCQIKAHYLSSQIEITTEKPEIGGKKINSVQEFGTPGRVNKAEKN
jgi:hypothetical protein